MLLRNNMNYSSQFILFMLITSCIPYCKYAPIFINHFARIRFGSLQTQQHYMDLLRGAILFVRLSTRTKHCLSSFFGWSASTVRSRNTEYVHKKVEYPLGVNILLAAIQGNICLFIVVYNLSHIKIHTKNHTNCCHPYLIFSNKSNPSEQHF